MKINTMCLLEGLCNKAKLKPIGNSNFLNNKIGMLFKGTEEGFPTRCSFQELLGENSQLDFYIVVFTYEGLRLEAKLSSNLEIVQLDVGDYFNAAKLAEIGWTELQIKEEETSFLSRKLVLEEKVKSWLPTMDDF